MPKYSIAMLTVVFLLSGCSAVVTRENAKGFDSWELCTLLYNPTSIYADWISMDDEDAAIRQELLRRGISSQDQCTFESLAERKCINVGFKQDTTEFANCRLTAEQNFNKLLLAKKSAHDSNNAAAANQNLMNYLIIQQATQPPPVVVPPPTPNFNW